MLINAVKKTMKLLTRQERRQFYWLLPAVVLMGLLELIGITSIMPFLALVANPDAVHTNEMLNRIYTAVGFSTPYGFLIFLGAVATIMLVLSNTFTAFMTWRLIDFGQMCSHSLARRLLLRYMNQPYIFFVDRNTSELRKNIVSEAPAVINGILLPFANLLSKVVATLFIVILLIAVDPALALAVALAFGIIYASLYAMVRRKLAQIGEERVEAKRRKTKALQQALGGIKDSKVLGRERVFLGRYEEPALLMARNHITGQVIPQLPRFGLEALTFGGIVAMVLYLLAAHQDLGQVLPVIGLYAFASYRLMPALQTIFAGIATIRTHLATLNLVYHEFGGVGMAPPSEKLAAADRSAVPPLPFEHAIELRNLGFQYPSAARPTFRNLNISIKARTSVAFVGVTGSGKTTAMDILLGLLTPQEGQVLIDGVPLDETTLPRWQKNLGYVPQHIYLCDDTIASNIAFGVPEGKIDMAAVERAAKVASIHDFVVNDLPNGYSTFVGERGVRLSGGQRQRIGIARALYHDPAVLIMDEATNALDGITEGQVFDAVANVAKSKTLIMVAHRISTVRNCNTIFLLERGQVVAQGNYQELLSSSLEFRAMAQTRPSEPHLSPS